MLEVVGHVVAAEGEHDHGVEAELAHLAAGGGHRAWMREADLKILWALVVQKETVLLHAFMNCPEPDWAAF
jgi:hypothetical protein